MYAGAVHTSRIAPGASMASSAATLFVDQRERDVPGVLIPRPEIHIVARYGPSARGELDVHAFGVRRTVHRKLLQRGQRAVTARLALGAPEAVLGAPASALSGRIVALEELWGAPATRRLLQRLAGASNLIDAAAILESTLAERLAVAKSRRAQAQLALDAVERLASAGVNAVAEDLGVSERHLRRVFHETIGVSPKTFAKLTRFRRALGAATIANGHASWANIAAQAGYYDQSHLIAEFRAIAGATPEAFVSELRTAHSVG